MRADSDTLNARIDSLMEDKRSQQESINNLFEENKQLKIDNKFQTKKVNTKPSGNSNYTLRPLNNGASNDRLSVLANKLAKKNQQIKPDTLSSDLGMNIRASKLFNFVAAPSKDIKDIGNSVERQSIFDNLELELNEPDVVKQAETNNNRGLSFLELRRSTMKNAPEKVTVPK